MPRNCSADFQAIVKHVDDTLLKGSPEDKSALKKQFGLEDLEYEDDVGGAICAPIYDWQNLQFYDGYSQFFQMCDAIEGYGPNTSVRATGPATEKGVGLETGLANYASWFTNSFLPDCRSSLAPSNSPVGTALTRFADCQAYGYSDWTGTECFNTHNSSQQVYHDYTSSNTYPRPYMWLLCNEPFFYYTEGAPPAEPLTLFTRLVTPAYYDRQCGYLFPAEGDYTYGSAGGRLTAADTNARLGGWDFVGNSTRFLRVNAEFDPWLPLTVSSAFRPGGPLASTPEAPVLMIEGGRHANDMLMANDVYPPIKAVHEAEIKQIVAWVDEFYTQHPPPSQA